MVKISDSPFIQASHVIPRRKDDRGPYHKEDNGTRIETLLLARFFLAATLCAFSSLRCVMSTELQNPNLRADVEVLLSLLQERSIPTPPVNELDDGGVVFEWVSPDQKQTLNVYVDVDGMSSDFNSVRTIPLQHEHREFEANESGAAAQYIELKVGEMGIRRIP